LRKKVIKQIRTFCIKSFAQALKAFSANGKSLRPPPPPSLKGCFPVLRHRAKRQNKKKDFHHFFIVAELQRLQRMNVMSLIIKLKILVIKYIFKNNYANLNSKNKITL
jgi:hypothetical protein